MMEEPQGPFASQSFAEGDPSGAKDAETSSA
jgi:hypothetical protein